MIGELCALSSALVWASALILFKRSEGTTPLAQNLFKNVLAIGLLLLTLPLLGVSMNWQRSPAEWATLALSGLLGIAVADTLFLTALRRMGPGLFAVVECVYTPTVVLFSALWLHEPITTRFLVGAAMVVGGVTLANIEPRVLETAVESAARAERRVGVAYGLLGIVALAVGIILAKPALETGELTEVVMVRLVAGVLGLLAFSLHDPRSAFAAFRPGPQWRTLVPAAILSTYVAMLLWLAGFKYAGVSVATVLNQSSTVWTLLFARLFLGEPLSPRRVGGGLVAVAGVVWILVG